MRRSGYSDSQIIAILKQAEAGGTCRRFLLRAWDDYLLNQGKLSRMLMLNGSIARTVMTGFRNTCLTCCRSSRLRDTMDLGLQ